MQSTLTVYVTGRRVRKTGCNAPMFTGAGRCGSHRCGPLASVGFAVEDGGGEFLGRFG